MRKLQETGTGGRRRGRNMNRQRLVDGDQATALAYEPVLEWAKEIQAMHRRDIGACTRGELSEYWLAARSRKTRRWADVTGPIDATWLTLRRLQWTWLSPWLVVDDKEMEIDLTLASTRLLRWHLQQSSRRQLEAQVSKQMQQRGWQDTGKALSSAAVRLILAEKQHSNSRKGIARSLALGSWWTMGRWNRAGYQVSDHCPMCRQAGDTMWHRLWQCPATKDLRSRPGMSTVVARALAAGPSSAIYSTGLVPNPDATAPGPSIEHLGDQIGQEPPWDPQLGELFWDGSASTWAIEGCNRAAWAVVQMRPGDQAPTRTVKGVVPHCYPQSAQAAETCALWASTILQARPPATTQQHSADSHSNSADTAASSHINRNTSGSHISSSDPHSPLLQWGDCANVVQRALREPLLRPSLGGIMYGDIRKD